MRKTTRNRVGKQWTSFRGLSFGRSSRFLPSEAFARQMLENPKHEKLMEFKLTFSMLMSHLLWYRYREPARRPSLLRSGEESRGMTPAPTKVPRRVPTFFAKSVRCVDWHETSCICALSCLRAQTIARF
eukprot:3005081-Amphidinium_carterae.1